MIFIQPIEDKQLAPLLGFPVLVVMKDGHEHSGVLTHAAGGKLTLNGSPEAPVSTKSSKTVKSKGKHAKAKASAHAAPRLPAAALPPALPPFGPKVSLQAEAVSYVVPLLP